MLSFHIQFDGVEFDEKNSKQINKCFADMHFIWSSSLTKLQLLVSLPFFM